MKLFSPIKRQRDESDSPLLSPPKKQRVDAAETQNTPKRFENETEHKTLETEFQ